MSERESPICTTFSKPRSGRVDAVTCPPAASSAASSASATVIASGAMKSSDDDSEFKVPLSAASDFRGRSRSTSIYETSKAMSRATSTPKLDHPESRALFFADPDSHLDSVTVGRSTCRSRDKR